MLNPVLDINWSFEMLCEISRCAVAKDCISKKTEDIKSEAAELVSLSEALSEIDFISSK